jgi:lysophospholipase L1-like esterase
MRSSGRFLAKLLVMAATTLAALKFADLALGTLRGTQQRHLLRLPENASYRHHSSEFDYTFTANSLGLRGPERSLDKPAGTRRIAVIGDSFIAGYGVADQEVLTVHLEQLLNAEFTPPTEVINVGRSGSSTVREYDLYRLVARRFSPEIVILAYFLGNDLREVVEEHDQDELREWHPRGSVRRAAYAWCPNLYLELALLKQSARVRQAAGPRTEAAVLAVLRRECQERQADYETALAAYRLLPEDVRQSLIAGRLADHQILPGCYDPSCLRRAIDPDDGYFAQAWPRTQRHLDLLQQAVTGGGGQFVVLIIPDTVQMDAGAQFRMAELGYEVDPDWLTRPGRTQQAVQAWCERTGVPCWDLTERLRQSSQPLYFLRDGHFNPAGHRRAAELLAELITSKFSE